MIREAAPPLPPRPDPWATTEPREALRDNNAARIMSTTPGAFTRQIGNRSVPCFGNMVDFCGHDEDYSPDVFFTGQKAMTLRSKTQHVHGGGSGGKCEPIEHAAQVFVNGSPAIRDGDQFYMDDRRTVGEANFARDTACYPAPKDTDPIPGSTRTLVSNAVFHPSDASEQGGSSNGLLRTVEATTAIPNQSPFAAPPGQQAPRAAPRFQSPTLAPNPPGFAPPGSPLKLVPYVGTLLWGWQLGGVTGDMLRETMEGPDGDTAKEIYQGLELQVPRDAGQPEAIREADGPLPYVGYEGDIRFANNLLSLKSGEIVDFRTMDKDELAKLLNAPWPSADDIRRNADKLEVRRKLLERMKPGTLPTSNIRVTPQCRSETICFDKEETNDPTIPMKFDAQLKMQQDALNAKTPAQVLGSIPPDGEVENLRPLARSAQEKANRDYKTLNQRSYLSNHTQEQWNDRLSKLNAIHRLDMVAGGSPTDIVGMGDADANQAIGRQWPADRRRGVLRRYAAEMMAKRCPMNIRLSVC